MDGSLILGVVGLVLAVVSLALQALTHHLSGGRARVRMGLGRADSTLTSLVLIQDWVTQAEEKEYTLLFHPIPVVIVSVSNRGRMPVTIAQIGFRDLRGFQMIIDPGDAKFSDESSVPCRVEGYDGRALAVKADLVMRWLSATQGRQASRVPFRAAPMRWVRMRWYARRSPVAFFAFVQLSDGRDRESWRPTSVQAINRRFDS